MQGLHLIFYGLLIHQKEDDINISDKRDKKEYKIKNPADVRNNYHFKNNDILSLNNNRFPIKSDIIYLNINFNHKVLNILYNVKHDNNCDDQHNKEKNKIIYLFIYLTKINVNNNEKEYCL